MRLSVIGTGYLGAVHAACMARLGHDVVAFHTDASKSAKLSAGTSPLFEPGLDELLTVEMSSGRLRFTQSPDEAVAGASVHFVCVGTPQLPDSDAADVSYVNSAVDMIATHADGEGLIVGKSTVPVGTAQRLDSELAARSLPHRMEVAWNPEFLREGKAIEDTLQPDRLVFGVTSESAEKTLREVYADLLDAGTPYLTTDLATAEMVKVAANSSLATKISFINAMAEVCEAVDADVVTLSEALDTTVGSGADSSTLGSASAVAVFPLDRSDTKPAGHPQRARCRTLVERRLAGIRPGPRSAECLTIRSGWIDALPAGGRVCTN